MDSNFVKKTAIKALALIFCTLPVTVCALSFFPLWIEKGGAHVLSGFAVLLSIFSLSPLLKYVKTALKSPASYTLWFIAFILFLLLSKIADEMTIISFVGFVGNLVGAMLFKLAEKYENKKEN